MSMTTGIFYHHCEKCGATWDNRVQQHICGLRQSFMETMGIQKTDQELLEEIKKLFHEYEDRIKEPTKKYWALVIWQNSNVVLSKQFRTRPEAIHEILIDNHTQHKQTITITHNPEGWPE